MKQFDVQSVALDVPLDRAFAYIADSHHLPEWTHAFAEVSAGRARMRTPQGEVDIALEVRPTPENGTVDWHMTFPDGTVATAFSRLVSLDEQRCIYSFVLTPPPVPLEQLEGALEAQSRILSEELMTLKQSLEGHV